MTQGIKFLPCKPEDLSSDKYTQLCVCLWEGHMSGDQTTFLLRGEGGGDKRPWKLWASEPGVQQ